jgi:hypothetical protein
MISFSKGNMRELHRIFFGKFIRGKKYSRADWEYRLRELKRWWDRQWLTAKDVHVRVGDVDSYLSEGMNRGSNPPVTGPNLDTVIANMQPDPEKRIYIYNLSSLTYEMEHPLFRGGFKFRACPKDKPYVLVTSIPQFVKEPVYRPDANEVDIKLHAGMKVVEDLLNEGSEKPMNFATGTDKTKRGMFYSYNNPPTDEEVKTARDKMEAFYQDELVKKFLLGIDVPELKTALLYKR